MSYIEPADQWAAEPAQAMTAALEASLSGLNHKLHRYLSASPSNSQWGIADQKDVDLQARMGSTSSFGRYRAKDISLLDIVASSLEFDRASQPGPPSTISYNWFNDLGSGRARPRYGLAWTNERLEHWAQVSDSIALISSRTDAPVLPQFILSLARYSRWDKPLEEMIDIVSGDQLTDAKNVSATLQSLAKQGRYEPMAQLLQKVPQNTLVGVLPDLADALQELDDRGAFRYWGRAREEDSTLFLNHPMGDAPLGPVQALALEPIELACVRTGSAEIAVHALRNYLSTCQGTTRPWQEGFIDKALEIIDRSLQLNGDAWPTGEKRTTAGVRNAKIAPLVTLALEEACAPVLARLPDHLHALLDSAELNVLWKPEKLRQASGERVAECTRLLVNRGLDLNTLRFHTSIGASQPSCLRTYAPLHYAALSNSEDRVKTMIALLEMGADPALKDHAGRTAEGLLVDTLASEEAQRSWSAASRSWAAKQSALSAIEELGSARGPAL